MHDLAPKIDPEFSDEAVAQPAAIIERIAELSKVLPASIIKRILRDVHYELTSAWKYFMALGKEKQVLVLVDGFTTLPLSLARNNAFVIVHGMLPDEIELFQDLAVKRGITNYSCIQDMTDLATKFDLIVSAATQPADSILYLKKAEINRLLHPHTEFWIIASNQLSLGYAKQAIRRVWKKSRGKSTKKQRNNTHGIRFQFGYTRPILTQQALAFLQDMDCTPFEKIGLAPTIIDARTVNKLKQGSNGQVTSSSAPAFQRLMVEDVVIGASAKQPQQNYLDRFLEQLHEIHTGKGRIERYFISPGGKVLLFLKYHQSADAPRAIIKLPLNANAEKKVKKNHDFLEHFANSTELGDNRRQFFPKPFVARQFEGQPFYAEDWLHGKSGDVVKMKKPEYEHFTHQVFAFWLGIQQTFAKRYFFDPATFDVHVTAPLKRIFAFYRAEETHLKACSRLTEYLRERFANRELTLSMIHGDFSSKNIILDEKTYTLQGVIDWDMAQRMAFPVLDAFHYFVRAQIGVGSRSIIAQLVHALEKRNQDTLFASILQMYQDSFELEMEDCHAFVMMYWICRMQGHLDTLKYMDKSFVKRNFFEPLKIFEGLIK